MSRAGTVALGKVVGVHGVRGELKVRPFVPRGDVEEYSAFYADTWDELLVGGSPYGVEAVRPHKGVILVKLAGLDGREAAERLVGEEVRGEAARLPELPEGEYYEFELVGLEVYGDDGTCVGTVENIFPTGSNDVYEVRGPFGEVLIPAIEDVVEEIDLAKGRLTVRLLEGLLPSAEGPEDGERRRRKSPPGRNR